MTDKTGAQLTLTLKAESGYESHRITSEKWEKIQRVIHGTETAERDAVRKCEAIAANPLECCGSYGPGSQCCGMPAEIEPDLAIRAAYPQHFKEGA